MLILIYLAAIVAANLSVALFGPVVTVLNAFLFIGLDLVARDRLHEAWRGRGLVWKMGLLIVAGSAISWLLNRNAGPIALASCIAFAGAAVTDGLMYQALSRQSWLIRTNGSNIPAALVDSLLFPTIAFGSVLPWIVLGQFVAKVAGGAAWSLVLRWRSVESRGAS